MSREKLDTVQSFALLLAGMGYTRVHDFAGNQRFRVVRKLGVGGMGVVYEVDDLELGEHVALKTLHSDDAQALQRFKREFRALQDVQHPNLVRLDELHHVNGEWFFTMELVPGQDLLSYLHDEGRVAREVAPTLELSRDTVDSTRGSGLSYAIDWRYRLYDERRLRDAFRQLAIGIAFLHEHDMVHRDIKPSNVRVTPEGRLVILDFGLVLYASASRISSDGNIVGTAAYMAPEQATPELIGPASDWYSFGIVLYQALTGVLPFSGNALGMLLAKQAAPPIAPRTHLPDTPADLDSLCTSLLQPVASERPTDTDMLQALGARDPSRRARRTHAPDDDRLLFVGRHAELDALELALDEIRGGKPLSIVLEGPSGMGKSTIVSRFVDSLGQRRPHVVLRGRCYEREAVDFKALDGVIDALTTFLIGLPAERCRELVPRNASLLTRHFPVLGRVDALRCAPGPSATPADAVEARRWLAASLRELIVRISDRWPLILVIDDVHWTDVDSLEVLCELLDPRREPPPALLLVLTSQGPVPWSATPESMSDLCELRRFPIGRLPDRDAKELAHRLLGHLGLSTTRAADLAREGMGHPLFITELARHVERGGGGGMVLSLEEAIQGRVAALPAEAQHLLEVMALAGAPVALRVLESLAGLPVSKLDEYLRLLRIEGLALTNGERSNRHVELAHDRLREPILARLDHAQRLGLHARLAALLTVDRPNDPERIAQHYLSAGDQERAAEWFERAARRAEQALAFERAAALYRRQVELRPVTSSPVGEEAIAALLDYLAAESNGDLARILPMLSPDHCGFGTGPDEVVLNLDQLRVTLQRQFAQGAQVAPELELLRCVELGSDTCLIMALIRYRVITTKGERVFQPRYSFLMNRNRSRWQLVHLHGSMPSMHQVEGDSFPNVPRT